MRLSARRNVDLPQPLGPIIAHTARAVMSSDTLLRTWFWPKKMHKLRTLSAGTAVSSAAEGFSPAAAGSEAADARVTDGVTRASVEAFAFSVISVMVGRISGGRAENVAQVFDLMPL